ncbi:major tail tube protein [Vibrio phage Rostov 7]|uniref:head closure n=1 Tax=Vibrio phage X29 TaxID=1500713 RepID=UPI00045FDE19|nr:head closure [Vibrio phage X29]AHN84828.1 major tail tube protein [Vibrio phage phi 2]AIA10331.1 tail tube FII family protein [Vibrio phage X29]QBJ01020.1 major tail tube protein [Vibrio phage Rostov 7]
MSNPVPERLINFRVYVNGNNQAGVATVDLPDLEFMTDTVSGAGIAGEVDSPILGHLSSMTATVTWRTITSYALSLTAPKSHSIDFRGSQQIYDAASGELKSKPVRVSVKATPKRTGLGSLEVGSTTDSESEFEVTYLKLWIDGIERAEIDKYNFKFVIDGVDYLASVRSDLGI